MIPNVVSDSATDAARRLECSNMVKFFERSAEGFTNAEEVAVRWYTIWLTKGYNGLPELCKDFCLRTCNGEYQHLMFA